MAGRAPGRLPKTVEEAVRLLLGLVPQSEQARISALHDDDLINLHFGLGMWIRDNLGIWQGNAALLDATGESDADNASDVILRAFWLALRADLPKVH